MKLKIWNIFNSKIKPIKTEVISKLEEIQTDMSKRDIDIIKDRDKLQLAIDTMPIIYVKTDINTNILFSNKMFINIFGYPSNIASICSIDEFNVLKKLLRKKPNSFYFTSKMVALDKSIRYIKFNINIDVLNNEFIFYGDDITEVTLRLYKIEKYVTNIESIINNYSGCMLSIDNNGLITYINRAAQNQIQYNLLDVVNKKHIYDILDINKKDNVFSAINTKKLLKLNINTSSNTKHIVYAIITPMYSDSNNKTGYLIVWHNESFIDTILGISTI